MGLSFMFTPNDAAHQMDHDGYLRGMSNLLETVQKLSLAHSLSEIQHIVRSAARELVNCDGASFILRDHNMCYYADEDAIAPLWKGSRFPMSACVSGWSMLHRAPAVISDIYEDQRVPHEAYRPTFVHSLIMVPIRQIDPIGAIGAYWADHHEPTETEVSLMQALADSTSIAMENAKLYSELEERVRKRTADLEQANLEIKQLSITDELTGLYNRRGFNTMSEQLLKEGKRWHSQCLVAFIDVNGLKMVNDENGHELGDQLIVDVAHVLKETLRDSDVIARFGGDEFCVLALDPHLDEETLVHRLDIAFKERNRKLKRPYPISASIGVVCTNIDNTTSLDQLIYEADQRMYAQKRGDTTVN